MMRKRNSLLIIAVLFVLQVIMSCGGIDLKEDKDLAPVKILARTFGAEYTKANPEDIPLIKTWSAILLNDDADSILLQQALKYLFSKSSDSELLAANFADLMAMMGLDLNAITADLDWDVIREITKAFIEGVEITEKNMAG